MDLVQAPGTGRRPSLLAHRTAAPGIAVSAPVPTLSALAVSAMRSAARLDRYRATRLTPQPILDHERALLERRALRLLDAVRHPDDARWRWDQEGEA